MTDSARAQRDRLRWRCRRGMKELDVLLTRYVEERFDAAPPEERAAFEALLEDQDPVIYAYCLKVAPIPGHLAALIERITGRPSG
jgi:antitoxin CptB